MIFHPIDGGGPAGPIVVVFCMLDGTHDLITRTKFLRATAYMLSAHMLSQFRLSVCLSVRLSVRHTGDSCKNG